MKADGMIDVRRLIGEVAARNGIRVEPDDPAFALVTLNQLVLEEIVTRVDAQIRLGIAEFMDAVHKTEERAGKILGAEVREAAAAVREELQRDVGAARVGALELIRELHRQHVRMGLFVRCGTDLVVAATLAIGFWLGTHLFR
jgi:hypothetical protein